MQQILFFILGAIAGGFAVWLFCKKQCTPAKENLISKQASQKAQNKQKILELLERKEKISNDDVEKLLGASDSTCTRYLDQLEKEGEIEQVGKSGRFVHYKRIK